MSLLAGLIVLAIPVEGTAQTSPVSINTEHFEPSASQHTDVLNLRRPEILGHLDVSAGLFTHFADDPVQVLDPEGDGVRSRLVDHQLKVEVGGAIGLFDRAEIGVVVPVVAHQAGSDLGIIGGSGAAEGAFVSDIRATVQVPVLEAERNDGFGLGFAGELSIPSQATHSFNSDGFVGGATTVLASWASEQGYEVVGNFGFRMRSIEQLRNVASGHALRWGLGGVIPLPETDIDLFADLFGAYTLVSPDNPSVGGEDNSEAHPVEALVGGRYDVTRQVRLQAGGGAGISQGIGTPDFRVFASVNWAMRKSDRDADGILDRDDDCVETPEDRDAFEDEDGCPDPDNDDDGLDDSDDQCPDEAEDVDGFEDDDGCPDPDNDEDGIADTDDQCPDKAEDKDGFEDEDGCPDPDNDGDEIPDVGDKCPDTEGVPENHGCPTSDSDHDGIIDSEDGCPDESEDRDGFEDEDGCPDPDNDEDGIPDTDDECPDEAGIEAKDGCPETDRDDDGIADRNDECPEEPGPEALAGCPDSDGDGVVDRDDECPDEPENLNGIEDEDGCPDEEESRVEIVEEKIEIREKVHFDSGEATLQQRSHSLLREVATVLSEYPEITGVRIEGHTDDRGSAEYNEDLSQRRAAAVEKFLVGEGIADKRIVPKGKGEAEPVADNDTESGRAKNRRVEFVITAIAGEPVDGEPVIRKKEQEDSSK